MYHPGLFWLGILGDLFVVFGFEATQVPHELLNQCEFPSRRWGYPFCITHLAPIFKRVGFDLGYNSGFVKGDRKNISAKGCVFTKGAGMVKLGNVVPSVIRKGRNIGW